METTRNTTAATRSTAPLPMPPCDQRAGAFPTRGKFPPEIRPQAPRHAGLFIDPTYCVSLSWGIPIGKAFVFKGFANFIGSKGKDGFGAETAPETLIEAALLVDPFFKKESLKGRLFVGVGYQYWNNKFGNDASHDPSGGSKASLPQLQVEFHF